MAHPLRANVLQIEAAREAAEFNARLKNGQASPNGFLTALLASSALLGASVAHAQSVLPQGGKVVAGSAVIRAPSATTTTVTQTSNRAIVDWTSFSVGQGDTVQFVQPTAQSAILNRVTGSATSTIAGQITGNGQVYLVNPNGIVITKTGTVDLGGGFVASTLDIANTDFMNGKLAFHGNGHARLVSNAGAINIGRGGFAALLGGNVANTGTITVPLGKVALNSGEVATLDLSGDGFFQAALPGVGVKSSGISPGTRVQMRPVAVIGAVRDTVRMPDNLLPGSARMDGNALVLGDAAGNTQVSGTLDVSSSTGKGGSIAVGGSNITLTGATLNASGATGGGTITIGGGSHGAAVTGLTTASTVSIDAGSTIKADALTSGNGGNVTVWSNNATNFAGTISAQGLGASGNGGNAEVSGASLNYTGNANLLARNGKTGNLLLDPGTIVICHTGDAGCSGAQSVSAIQGDASTTSTDYLLDTTLASALSTANVSLSASVKITDTAATSVQTAGGGSLTLTAPNITLAGAYGVNAGLVLANTDAVSAVSGVISGAGGLTQKGTGMLTLTGVNTYTGSTTVNAGTLNLGAANALSGVTAVQVNSGATLSVASGLAATLATGSSLTLNNGSTLSGTGGGSLTFTGPVSATAVSVGNATVAGGTGFTLSATDSGASSFAYNLAGTTLTTTGVVTLNAIGAGNSGGNWAFEAANATLNASSGTLTINATPISGGLATRFQGSVTFGGNIVINELGTYSCAAFSGCQVPNITLSAGANVAINAATNGFSSYVIATNGVTTTLGAGSVLTIADTNGATLPLQLGGTWTVAGSGTLNVQVPVQLTSAATLANSATVNFNGSVSGSNSLTVTGNGQLNLNAANTNTGALTVNGGVVELGLETSLYNNTPASWTASNITVASGATLALAVGGTGQFTASDVATISGLGTSTGGFQSGANLGLDTTGGSFAYASNLVNPNSGANTLGLTKLGANTLTLSGIDTYTGSTTVNAGTLNLAGSWNVGAGTATTSVASGATLSGAGVITAASLSDSGAGTVNLSGANVISALTTSGTIGALTLANTGALRLGSITSSGGISISDSGTITANTGTNLVTTGQPISLTSTAGGISLSGTSITTNNGTLALGASGGGSATGISLNSVTINTGSGYGNIYGTSTSATGVSLNGTSIATSSASGLSISGTSTSGQGFALSGTNTFANSGTGSLALTGTSTSGNGALLNATTLTTSGNVTIAGASSTGWATYLAGSVGVTNTGGNLAINGTSPNNEGIEIYGTVGLTNSGSGSFALTGTETGANLAGHTSGLFVWGSTLTTSGNISLVGNNTTVGGVGYNSGVGLNGTLINVSSGNLTIQGTSSGADAIYFQNGSTLNNNGTGSFNLTGSETTGAGVYFSSDLPGALITSGAVNIIGTASSSGTGVSLAGGGSITASSGNLTISGTSSSGTGFAFTGANSVTNSGTGSLALTGTSTSGQGFALSGTNTFANSGAGSLVVVGQSSSGWNDLAGTLNVTAGNVSFNGTSTTTAGIYVDNSAAFLNAGTGTLSINGTSGQNGIYFCCGADTTSGTVVFTGNSTNSNPGASGVQFWPGMTVTDLAGNLTINGSATTNSGFSLNTPGGTSPVSFVNAGIGIMALNGTSSSAAGFAVNDALSTSGTVQITGTSTSGPGIGFVGGTLANSGGNLTVTGTTPGGAGVSFSGTNAITNSGTGTLTLTGLASTTGGVGVYLPGTATLATSGGMTITDGASSAASTALNLAGNITDSSGTLTLGSVNGASSVSGAISGAGSLATEGGQILTLSGANTYTGSTTVNAGTLNLAGSWNVGAGTAITSVASGATLSGAGVIIAASLSDSGAGTVNLSGANAIGAVMATGTVGAFTLNDAQSLNVGSLTSSGAILLTTNGANADLTLMSGANVSSTTGGTAVTLSAANAFINNSGSGAVSAPNGRWLVYSLNPSADVFGALDSSNVAVWDAIYTGTSGSVAQVGNRYVFAWQPTLSFISTNLYKVYGSDNSAALPGAYTVTGYQTGVAGAFLGDTAATAWTGTPTLTSAGATALAQVADGPFAINLAQGTVAGANGYAVTFASPGQLTVGKASLTLTGDTTSTTYNGGAQTNGYTITSGQLYGSDAISSVAGLATGTNAGTYTDTLTGATGTGLSNYTIGYVNGSLAIGKATLTLIGASNSTTYNGTTQTNAGATLAGLQGSDSFTITGYATGTNAGSYTDSLGLVANGGTLASNYNLNATNGVLTIGKASLTLTGNTTSTTYNGGAQTNGYAITSGQLFGSDAITSVAGLASGTNAGTYADSLSGAIGMGLSNYTIGYVNGSLAIGKATLTLTGANNGTTYNGTAQSNTGATLAGLQGSDSFTITGYATGTNAGTYTDALGVSANGGTLASNYNLNATNGVLTIGKASLTLTGNTTSTTYNGGAQTNGYAITSGQLFGSDAITSVAGLASGTNAGTYADSLSGATGTGLSNYTIGYVNGSLAIGKATLTLTGANNGTTYNGTAQSNTGATLAGLQGSDSFTITGYATGTNAGTYTDALGVSANGGTLASNYNLNATNGVLTIGKASLTLTGNTTSTTYNGGAQTNGYAITSGQLFGSDAITSVAGLASGTNAGTYADSLSGATGTGLSNYTIGYVNGSLAIGKATLTLTGANNGTTYNGTAQSNTGATLAGLQGSDSFTITGYATGTNAGTYTDALGVSANGGTLASNYNLNATNGVLTIGKASLTLTGNTTSTTYNGGAQTNGYAITSGQLFGSDAITSVAGLASGTNAGTYADSLSGATGTGLSNYTIGYVNGSLAIGKATLTLTGANNGTTYNGTAQSNTGATLAGLQGSDSFTITGYATGTNAGSYTDSLGLVANGGTLASNYNLNATNGALTIGKASLTLTGNTTSTTYNGGAQTNGYAITSGQLFGSDAITSVAGLASGTNAGTYADSLSGAIGTGLSNYTIGYVNGSLAIGKATLTLTGANNGTTYNGTAQSNTGATLAGLQGSDSFTITGYATGTNAGTYTDALGVSANGGTLASNYNLNATNGVLTIGKASLTLTGNTTSTTYNGGAQTNGYAITSGQLFGSDAITSVAGLASGTNAGTYADSLSGATGTGLSNYTIGYVNGSLAIGKATLTLTGANNGTTYNGTAQSNTGATLAGLQGSDSFTITGYATGTNAGSYTDSLALVANGGTLASNYNLNATNGVLTIGKASLTLTGNTTSVTYNGGAQTNSGATLSGVQGSDSFTVTGYATGTNAGSYTDTLGVAVNGTTLLSNYTLTAPTEGILLILSPTFNLLPSVLLQVLPTTSKHTGENQINLGGTKSGVKCYRSDLISSMQSTNQSTSLCINKN